MYYDVLQYVFLDLFWIFLALFGVYQQLKSMLPRRNEAVLRWFGLDMT